MKISRILCLLLCIIGPPIAGYFIWQYVTRVEAKARIRVSHPVDDTGRVDEYAWRVMKDTHMALLQSTYAITPALQKTRTGQLSLLSDMSDDEDIVEVVRSRMKVTTEGDSEIIDISLTGKHPDEVKYVLNAIINTYTSQAASADTMQLRRHMQVLQMREAELNSSLSDEASRLAQLRKVSPESPDVVVVEIHIKHLSDRIGRVQVEIDKARERLTTYRATMILIPAYVEE